MLGGLSFYALSGLQRLLLSRAGLHISDGYTCMPGEDFGRTVAALEKIYKLECIPWLVFGFALSMLLFVILSFAATGNPVTKFCRENAYLISVLLFSRHLYRLTNGKGMAFWTDLAGFKEEILFIVPFIYFTAFTVLAYLINLIINNIQKKRMRNM